MAKELKPQARPDSEALGQLAAGTADALDDAAEAEGTSRKVIITHALAAAGYPVQPADLEDRTPRRRRQRQAA